MSDLKVTTISDLAGTGPVTLTKQSAAKAWVNFNGTGTIAVRESYNVASLTDTAIGIYKVNLTSSMSNADYSNVSGSLSMVFSQATCQDISTASSVGIKIQDGAASTFIDASIVSTHVAGDLA